MSCRLVRMCRSVWRVLKPVLLALGLLSCLLALVMYASLPSLNCCGYPSAGNIELLEVKSETVGPDKVQAVHESTSPQPPSFSYSGRPISQIYEPGWDADATAACRLEGAHLVLIVVVVSSPGNLERRTAIRSTWGSLRSRKDADLVFLLGKSSDELLARKVRNESEAYGDVVVSRNVDTYANLTLKTIAMSEWVSRRCPSAKFFMKVDDDSFLNVPRLVELLQRPEVSSANRTMFGRKFSGAPPMRYKKSHHYVSTAEYPGKMYPDYVQGGCYLVTGDLSADLHRAALRGNFFKMEDVFFTGLMAELVGADRVSPPDFYDDGWGMKIANQTYLMKVRAVDPCALRAKVAINNVNQQQAFAMWQSLFDRKLKC